MLERMGMLPAPPYRFVGEYIFANALLDTAQLLLPLGVFMAVNPDLSGNAWVILVCVTACIVAAKGTSTRS